MTGMAAESESAEPGEQGAYGAQSATLDCRSATLPTGEVATQSRRLLV